MQPPIVSTEDTERDIELNNEEGSEEEIVTVIPENPTEAEKEATRRGKQEEEEEENGESRLYLSDMPDEILMMMFNTNPSDGELAAFAQTSKYMRGLFEQELKKREKRWRELNKRAERVLDLLERRNYDSYTEELQKFIDSLLVSLKELKPELRKRFFKLIIGVDGQNSDISVRMVAAKVIGAALASGAFSQKERKALIKALIGVGGAGGLAQDDCLGARAAVAQAIVTALASDALLPEERDAEREAERNVLIEALIGVDDAGGLAQDEEAYVRKAAAQAMSMVELS